MFGALLDGVPKPEGIERRTETITGVDGNDITLYVDRPVGAQGPLPGLLHLHGGGMAISQAADESASRWRGLLADAGLRGRRRGVPQLGGCAGAASVPGRLERLCQRARLDARPSEDLGLASIVVTGESGGGNLTLATTLKAKRDGRLDRIDGVYAQAPFIYGGYDTPDPALPSLIENEGYFLGPTAMTLMATLYDPAGEHATNPLAWPYFADCPRSGGPATARDHHRRTGSAARRGSGLSAGAAAGRGGRHRTHLQRGRACG